MIDKIGHYSLTNPDSVYDEEAMTALELAGRTAGKVNECVEAFNELEGAIDETVDASVQEHIQKGTFDQQIDAHTKALTKDVDTLTKEVTAFDNRLDNLVLNGSENSPEVVDIRLGADGVTYKTAGGAVRGQLNKKIDADELYPVEYETGALSITEKGWDYSEQYAKNSRVRIKEGRELSLKAGDIIGLRNYSDARFYVGIRIDGVYSFAGWLTRDYVVESDGDYVVLIAHTIDPNLNQPEDPNILGSLLFVRKLDGVANRANRANENIQSVLNIDLGFTLGAMNTDGLYNAFNRYVTPSIHCLDIDIVVKHNDMCRVSVYTFTDINGKGVSDKGWVTDKGDYIIKAGTYFRLMVMASSYDIEAQTHITPSEQFDHELYKAITIEPLNGRGINLMHTVTTLARVNTFKTMTNAQKVIAPRKVKAINHRGYNYEATENTLKAFKLSKKNGFDFVECDVRFSSDGIPVLFHDDTVDRISNGTGRVCDMTLDELKALDLGGESIATFSEFIKLCAMLQLHPYIEIEPDGDNPITPDQTKVLMDIVESYGMKRHVSWISFRAEDLMKVIQLDTFARVGLIVGAQITDTDNIFKMYASLMTGLNEVFIDLQFNSPLIGECVATCARFGAPLEVWTVNSDYPDGVLVVESYPYISGVTSDNADIGQVIIERLTGGSKVIKTVTFAKGPYTDETVTFEYEDGMTWRELATINSDLLITDYGSVETIDSNGCELGYAGGGWVNPDEVIDNTREYNWQT